MTQVSLQRGVTQVRLPCGEGGVTQVRLPCRELYLPRGAAGWEREKEGERIEIEWVRLTNKN